VSVLATLSTHAETHPALADDALVAAVARLKDDPRLGPYAACFLKCVRRADDG
jgi:hypothetical protein